MKPPAHNPGSEAQPRRHRPAGALWILGLWLLTALLAGCAVGPHYRRPPTDTPAAFRGDNGASGATNSLAELPWWQIFQDERLQELIRTALTNNYDLRIATARVEQARAAVTEARSQFLPQVNYAAGVGRGKNVSDNLPSPTGVSGGVFLVDANASWEIDLWGRIRRLTESSKAQYFATQEARRDITISLISEVAQDYFQLLALDRELEIAEDSTNSFGESLKIFNERLKGGVASKLETSAAEALLDTAAGTIPQLRFQIGAQEDQISILIGRRPDDVARGDWKFEDEHLPVVPPGLPSTLLERRPDVREAEQQLRSANAQVGVAVADFFPQLDLTGLVGGASPELNTVTAGGNVAWSLAAGLTGPLFHGGQLRAQYQEARAIRDQSALQYQSTVLNALRETSDALIMRDELAAAREQQRRAVEAYQEAVKISLERYRLGNSSYYEVLQEQQALFPAENSLTQIELNQLVSVVDLYRALGGGWEK